MRLSDRHIISGILQKTNFLIDFFTKTIDLCKLKNILFVYTNSIFFTSYNYDCRKDKETPYRYGTLSGGARPSYRHISSYTISDRAWRTRAQSRWDISVCWDFWDANSRILWANSNWNTIWENQWSSPQTQTSYTLYPLKMWSKTKCRRDCSE